MGVSTGQIFQPKIMSSVEPQRQESTWEKLLPTILSGIAQTTVSNYLKEKMLTDKTASAEELELKKQGFREIPTQATATQPSGITSLLGIGKTQVAENPLPGVAVEHRGKYYLPPALDWDKDTNVVTYGGKPFAVQKRETQVELPYKDESGKTIMGSVEDYIKAKEAENRALPKTLTEFNAQEVARGKKTYAEALTDEGKIKQAGDYAPGEFVSEIDPEAIITRDAKGGISLHYPKSPEKGTWKMVEDNSDPKNPKFMWKWVNPGQDVQNAVAVGELGVLGQAPRILPSTNAQSAQDVQPTPSPTLTQQVLEKIGFGQPQVPAQTAPSGPQMIKNPMPQQPTPSQSDQTIQQGLPAGLPEGSILWGKSVTGKPVYRLPTPDANGRYQYRVLTD